MKKRLKMAGAILALGGLIAPAKAAIIEYQLADHGGGSYTYAYNVRNNTATPITEFTIYFSELTFAPPTSEYSGFTEEATPFGWDFLSAEASAIDLSGYVDWYSSIGLASGESLAGFKVNFTYTGSGMPGSQYFDIFDDSFSVVYSDMTTPVPEPSTWMAGAFAALLLAGRGIGRKPFCKKD